MISIDNTRPSLSRLTNSSEPSTMGNSRESNAGVPVPAFLLRRFYAFFKEECDLPSAVQNSTDRHLPED